MQGAACGAACSGVRADDCIESAYLVQTLIQCGSAPLTSLCTDCTCHSCLATLCTCVRYAYLRVLLVEGQSFFLYLAPDHAERVSAAKLSFQVRVYAAVFESLAGRCTV